VVQLLSVQLQQHRLRLPQLKEVRAVAAELAKSVKKTRRFGREHLGNAFWEVIFLRENDGT
jgi:hypothetical protein